MVDTWDGNGSMMWGMGWSGVLLVSLVIVCIAALAKYLLSSTQA